jgi:hypothetical protein
VVGQFELTNEFLFTTPGSLVESTWMEQNPYASPKELPSQPTIKAGVGIGVLLLLSVPAGCVCGGVTCYASGIAGEMTVEQRGGPIDSGFAAGIPIGLVVVILIPALAIYLFGRRRGGGKIPE